MKVNEIKWYVEQGYIVCWASDIYRVTKDRIGQFHIVCQLNSYCIGLTRLDGTLNGKEDEFYVLTNE